SVHRHIRDAKTGVGGNGEGRIVTLDHRNGAARRNAAARARRCGNSEERTGRHRSPVAAPLAAIGARGAVVGAGASLGILLERPQGLVIRGINLSGAEVAPPVAPGAEVLVVVVLARLVN